MTKIVNVDCNEQLLKLINEQNEFLSTKGCSYEVDTRLFEDNIKQNFEDITLNIKLKHKKDVIYAFSFNIKNYMKNPLSLYNTKKIFQKLFDQDVFKAIVETGQTEDALLIENGAQIKEPLVRGFINDPERDTQKPASFTAITNDAASAKDYLLADVLDSIWMIVLVATIELKDEILKKKIS